MEDDASTLDDSLTLTDPFVHITLRRNEGKPAIFGLLFSKVVSVSEREAPSVTSTAPCDAFAMREVEMSPDALTPEKMRTAPVH